MTDYYKLLQVDDEGISSAAFSAMCTSAISGGDLVSADAQNGVVAGSTVKGYETTDVHVRPCDSAANCVGIALTDAGVSGIVGIATQGVFLLPAGSNEFRAGSKISACGYDHAAVETCGDESGAHVIGTALTTGSVGHSASATSLGVVRLHI